MDPTIIAIVFLAGLVLALLLGVALLVLIAWAWEFLAGPRDSDP